jgi:hypothetical protein
MLNGILEKLGLKFGWGDGSLNQDLDTRRKYMRHGGILGEVIVHDRTYDLRDWSFGGLCFETALDPRIQVGERVLFTLKFCLPHETVSIRQAGRVVRAAGRAIAAEFLPLAPDIRRKFDRVLDGLHARDFLESQVVA